MTTKRAVTFTIIIAAPIGFWFGHSIGYDSGYSEGHSSGESYGIELGRQQASVEEKERPASMYTVSKRTAHRSTASIPPRVKHAGCSYP